MEQMNHPNEATKSQFITKVTRIIYYILGVLEVLFFARFIFKLLGANVANSFVSFIYSITKPFLVPFTSIFPLGISKGIEAALIIAILMYAILAFGIVKLIKIAYNRKNV